LESCLVTPFQSFSGKYFYPTFIAKASILFYLMIKNHPFQNGNKRIAMATLLFFFHKIKKWIRVDIQEFYNFPMWVTQSPRIAKEETIKAIEKFFKKYIINLE
jgi:prophage maintenance system killer protein